MTRKRLTGRVVIVRTSITLREGEDDDLLEAFLSLPERKRAVFIKSALRQGGLQAKIEGLPGDDDLVGSLESFIL